MATNFDIAQRRLCSQLIAQHMFGKPEDVVSWLGAVQAQDYAAAKWAIGLRTRSITDVDVEQAFNDGTILRTHLMRPTWHFVSPADIRWLLTLTAPRVHAMNARGYRELELDDATCRRCNDVLVTALQGGKQLTRSELASALQQMGIATDDLRRIIYILMHAELDGIICSGARRGKQFTYALLDERAPRARKLDRNEALAELTLRYFTSHGPATSQDFVWWSGLTMADVTTGITMVASQLLHETLDDQTYWFSSSPTQSTGRTAYLLPSYDEYTVGYKDRSAVFDPSHAKHFDPRSNVLNSVIVIDGRVIGTWRRTIKKNSVIIMPHLFTPPNKDEVSTLSASVKHYSAFLDIPVHANFQIE